MQRNSSWSDLEIIKTSGDTVFKKMVSCNKDHISMIFNVALRFINSRYKVSLKWDSNSRLSDLRSDTLPTELARSQNLS